jgi:hypothetical protein
MKLHCLVLLLLGCFFLTSCEKPEEALVICETDTPVTSVAEFHRLFAPAAQVYRVSTSQAQNVQLLDGASLFVPAQAFVLRSGALAVGSVELRIKALTKPVDMVLGGLPTMSFWRPIESGGQVHISALLNGTVPVRLRPGFALTMSLPKLPSSSANGLTLWTGVQVVGSTLTWLQDTTRVRIDSTPSGQQYFQAQLRSDTLGWSNIGRLWTSNPADTTLLRADVAGDASARVYLLPTQRSGAFMMKWNSQTRLMELYGVPVGTETKVIVLRHQGGELLVGTDRIMIRRGAVLRLPLQAMSAQAAADRIRQF